MGFANRIQHAWNAFLNRDPTGYYDAPGNSSYSRPDRPRFTGGNERSIINSIYNRIAVDVASINIQHVRLDNDGRFIEIMKSGLNTCLTLEANVDQTGRAFVQDIVMSMFDEGCVAVVPIDTNIDPNVTGSYDIESMRTGKIIEWFPKHVRVRAYNEANGQKQDITVAKSVTAIIENPLYSVMNEPNSTMRRLVRKLNLLDAVDEQSSSGKLDLIIQLPYTIKTDSRRQQADKRRKDIEEQLSNSKFGIAYVDSTERITQLNRPVENNLMKQVEYLTSMLHSQLGMTQGILDGTADEKTMLNYYNRTVEPCISAIVDEFKRKFLTKTARSQNQSVAFFRDPFKLVPISNLAEIADKFTRNEIMSSNEIRQILGMKPSDDPKADKLENKNIRQPGMMQEEVMVDEEMEDDEVNDTSEEMTLEEYQARLKDIDDLDSQLDELESELDDELKHYASPYYDPVKAHEYYMRTRELKGRTSTSTLNDAGKNAARYVREGLNNERKAKVQEHKTQTDSKIDTLRDQRKTTVESHKAVMQNQIDRLRDEIKRMSPEEKARYKDKVYAEIDDLREDNKKARIDLQNEFKASSNSLRTAHKEERSRLKEEYSAKYQKELEGIRADSKFQKVSKRKKKSR